MHAPSSAGDKEISADNIPPLTHLQLFTIASGFIGLQVCWAVQIGYVTKSLLELGFPERYVSYAWLAGPIAGVIVQPVVGLLSDRCTSRFGRRRPFLVAGSAVSVIFLFVFAYAEQMGEFLGDDPNQIKRPKAVVIAIVAFWVLDFAINAAQGPVRTLLADVAPPCQHNIGNSFFALALGIGNGVGSLLGAVRLSRVFPFFPSDLHALYAVAALILIITMGVTVIFTKEEPLVIPDRHTYGSLDSHPSLESADSEATQSETEPPRQMTYYEAARNAPHPFWSLFTVQFCQWLAWFALVVYATSWVGAEVYRGQFDAPKGSDDRELYDAGVRMGNLGMGLQAAMTIFSALLLPSIIERTSAKFVYSLASILLGIALTSSIFITKKSQAILAVLAIASTGFGWAVTFTVPWSIMSTTVAKKAPERAGVYFTMFNLAVACPEVVVALAAEEIFHIFNHQAAVLFIGGIFAFIASVLTCIFQLEQTEEDLLTEPLSRELNSPPTESNDDTDEMTSTKIISGAETVPPVIY